MTSLQIFLALFFLFKNFCNSQSPAFTCPNNANALVSNSGSNVFCTSLGTSSDCPTSSTCVTASNSASVLICCSQSTTITPICPNNALAQTSTTNSNGFVECTISNPITCSTGFQCLTSSNIPTVAICCSTTTSTSTCPTDFTPVVGSTGTTITCNPSSSGCPSGSTCLQSTQTSSFICCRSSNSNRICSNNQNALVTNGAIELCTTPGTACSLTGYTCQLSILLASYVCCGFGDSTTTGVQCLDNRPTYQEREGITYTCEINSATTGCPSGYDCAASDDPFIDVCCLTGSTPIPENLACPTGWNPYRNEVDNSIRTCSAVLDTSCPVGFSCAPSSTSQISFLCCRLATSLVCINGNTLLVNGAPKLCQPGSISQCPFNYSCQQSINPTVTVCCSS
ncbi:unnamed protein product [Caenorhabditis angaria]|uniref:Uncharacterized protein n=1 Tax=Caenorhabditis angaria TaxID=860376 RepID=A0A9P1IF72_9PELO|nr:unnamed protein product [Caenorhabditis angaria]